MRWIPHILRFALVLFLQLFLFNKMQIWSYVLPAFFLHFLLMLPINASAGVRLLSAFALGLLLDVFSHTMGLHTAAILPVAFVQPSLLRLIKMPREVDVSLSPTLALLGGSAYTLYAGLLIFLYHLLFFMLDAFSLSYIVGHLYMVAVNTIITYITVIAAQLIIYRRY